MHTLALQCLLSLRVSFFAFILSFIALPFVNTPLFSEDDFNIHDEDKYIDQDIHWDGPNCEEDQEIYPNESKQNKYRKNVSKPLCEGEAAPLANLEGEPSAFVHGCINVITGQYCELATDLVVYHGTDPIRYERSFAGCTSQSRLAGGWQCNHQSVMQYPTEVKKYNKNNFCQFTDDHGAKALEFIFKDNKIKLNHQSLHKGVTNTSQNIISGQSNMRNIEFRGYGNNTVEISTGAGIKKKFGLFKKEKKDVHRLTKEIRPNGNQWLYKYTRKKHKYNLFKINLSNKGGQLKGSILIQTDRADTNDGRWVSYSTHKSARARTKTLTKVASSDGPDIIYGYRNFYTEGNLKYQAINSKILPDKRNLKLKYYWSDHTQVLNNQINLKDPDDPRRFRVKKLFAPAGFDETLLPIYQFIYKIHVERNPKTKKLEAKHGSCSVYNALHYKTSYRFDENQRLMCINKFDALGQPYTHERLFWGANYSPDNTCLKARDVVYGNGTLFARGYLYDPAGNVMVDSTFGNLTGINNASPIVLPDGNILANGADCFQKHQNYTNSPIHPRPDNLNLLWRKHEGRLFTEYAYEPDSNRVSAKYEGDGTNGVPTKWLRRTFYTYNDDAAVVKEISDDGSAFGVDDLTDATERKIIYFTQSTTYPAAFPLVVEEKCLDFATGKEHLVHKVVNTYTKLAKISTQEHYDSNGDFAYSLVWDYDRMGNVIKEVNALGQATIRRYDANSNCIFEQLAGHTNHKIFTYDYMNRLIKVEDKHTDGQNHSITNRYDLASNKIATVDENGNETLFHYDAFGRIIEIIHPFVLNEENVVCRPTTKKEYNPLSKVTKETNSLGGETHMSYTIRGQLVETIHPDGTRERNTYNLDGTLAESKAKNNTVTKYTYDCFKRPIQVDIFDENGSLLSTSSLFYNSLHLISETDPSGIVSSYTYFADGKIKSKTKGDYSVSYFYDTLGRQNKTIECYGPNHEDLIVKTQEHDLLNRVKTETVSDANNVLISKIEYSYDDAGNVCKTVNYTQAGSSITQNIYNSHGVLETVIDAEGNKTFTIRKYDFRNTLGQIVGYQESTDPLGNIGITISDVFGRVTTKIRKNAYGKITQKQELAYDLRGNICKITDTVINGQDADQEIVSIMHYDICNRLTACYEAYGTPEQKLTKLAYNSYGQKEYLIKNDGITLSYTYDAMGRLKSHKSSDGSIDYAYAYDLNSHPIRVDDLVSRTATVRIYDPNGFMIREVLGNDLSMEYSHDFTGRIKEVVLSDSSKIGYAYHANLLKSVDRLGAQDQTLYSHQYDAYDLSGNPTKFIMTKSAGTLNFDYDIKGRLKCAATDGDLWKEEIKSYDSVGNILGISLQDSLGEVSSAYTYDDLYQMTSESGPADHSYSYDSHYNRRTKNGKVHILNPLNQLVDDGTSLFSYDRNGNMREIKSGEHTSEFVYDALDRLISFVKNGQKVSYRYDENNRRLSKTFHTGDTSNDWKEQKTVRYLYQGQNEIGSVDKSGKINELRILGMGKGAEIGAAVALEIDQNVYVPIHDHIGNVACLLDSATGDVVETYRYSTFGEEQFDGQKAISPWRFSSKRVDEESGLVYFGRRYYSAEIGRWVTPDPIGREGGPNVYAYVMNSPLTHFDLYGLYGMDCLTNIFANVVGRTLERSFKIFSLASHLSGNLVGFIGRDVLPVPYVNHLVEFGGYCLRGENPMTYDWSKHQSQLLVHQGFNHTHAEHMFIDFNGICTPKHDHQKRLGEISEANGGVTVYGIHTAYNGAILDALEFCCQKVGIPTLGQVTANREVSQLLAKQGENVGKTTIFTSAHSRGTETAYHMNSKARCQMDVTAYAPARIAKEGHYRNASYYTCGWDFVPCLCPIEYYNGVQDGRVYVFPSCGNPGSDHLYENPHFQGRREKNGQIYQDKYGGKAA